MSERIGGKIRTKWLALGFFAGLIGIAIVYLAAFPKGKTAPQNQTLPFTSAPNRPLFPVEKLQQAGLQDLQEGKPSEAAKKLTEAAALAQKENQPNELASSLFLLGSTALALGDSKTAKLMFQESIGKFEGDLPTQKIRIRIAALMELARILEEEKKEKEAASLRRQARGFCRQIGENTLCKLKAER